MNERQRLIVGCMTGTSIDALDAALVGVMGEGLGLRASFISAHTAGLGDLSPRLRALADQEPMRAGEIASLSHAFACRHAEAVRDLLRAARQSGAIDGWAKTVAGGGAFERPDLIAVHGQTVFHAPPVSWQLLNPWPIVREIGSPVVFDLRGADLAWGGEGAPITPIADWMLLRDQTSHVCVVNLGGFCNITVLPSSGALDRVRGFDVCVCNQLLDTIARRTLGCEFDDGGGRALAANVVPAARDELVSDLERYGSGRSLGTGDERVGWLERWVGRIDGASLARSAAEGIGTVIGRVCAAHDAGRVLLAGGGARNAALVGAIRSACGAIVKETDEFGVPGAYREAMAIGVLGALCADGVPITLSGVTVTRGEPGSAGKRPIGGCWAWPSKKVGGGEGGCE